MRRRDQRLMLVSAAAAVLVLAVTLTIFGLQSSVVYFVKPSELAQKAEAGHRIRLGGLVVDGTFRTDGEGVHFFHVTDGAVEVEVRYDGVLPDLFREGQGVVVEGQYTPGQAFVAERVLAKHDENYMPREVAEALKQSGEWKGARAP